MTLVRRAALLAMGLETTGCTAVTLPSIAVAANPKQPAAGAANPLT
jgi:hypothetical protein